MYFVVLATDYDGTLAQEGRVNAATIDGVVREVVEIEVGDVVSG